MSERVEIESFIDGIARQFEVPPVGLRPDTEYRSVKGWDSLRSLMVVASFLEDYGVSISDEEFAGATTLQGLYDLVIEKGRE